MVESLATTRELLAGNRQIPEDARQSRVLIRFVEPAPRFIASEFLRIHLTRQMLAGGEQSFYQVGVSQPQKLRPQRCCRCRGSLQRLSEWEFLCAAAGCAMRGKVQDRRPVRGVVDVLIRPEYEVASDSGRLINRAELVLDRRYREEVLACVYRTAADLAERLGWRIR